MRFSIIIPTINRKQEPLKILESLRLQRFKDFEVLLVDQNIEGFLDEVTADFGALKIKHLKTHIKGASHARNLGVKSAIGEILLFPDDDCEFHSDFLQQIHDYFSEQKADGILTTTKDKKDGSGISILLAKKGQNITRKNVLRTVIEAGIVVRAESLGSDMFDTKMGVGSEESGFWSDEGPDLVLRLLDKGLVFHFCPQFFMYHPNPVKNYNSKTTLRGYRYGKGRGYFLKKHNFGLHKIAAYLGIYVVGMMKGILYFDRHMFNYFKEGFKGRYEGYFKSEI